MDYQYSINQVHKDLIRAGDIILCSDGAHRTLCERDFGKDALLGRTIRGDSYKAGHEPVQRVDIYHAKPDPKLIPELVWVEGIGLTTKANPK